ncbi:MAG: PQQ-dependent sugar dehydrogenase, partial [Planctomycetia bacterium]
MGRAIETTGRSVRRFDTLEDRSVPAAVLPSDFAETTFATGFNQPTTMAFAPDGRLFVAEKGGALRVVKNGVVLPTPFLSVPVDTFSERGLLGVEFDPSFALNGTVYVYYTTQMADEGKIVNRVSKFVAATPTADVSTNVETVLLDDIPATAGNHNAGALHFGNDGFLYVATGDAGANPNLAQDLGSLAGKILRLDPLEPSLIPDENPFVAVPGARPEVFALGFRNPFTFTVHPTTGVIFVNDVGSNRFEEVNQLAAGGNYGWPTEEGA